MNQVEELLVAEKVDYRAKGKDFIVQCLNPEHDDSNPSMRVDQVSGIFNCFSCGYKGSIFQHFGHKPNFLQLKRDNLRKRISRKMSEGAGLEMPKGYMPYKGDWRGIKPETYIKFEAFTHHSNDHVGRVVFPVRNVAGKIVAFNGRHMTGETPKYMITPRGASMPLYPRPEPILGSAILVEGIFDVINLHDKGLPNAVCCTGVGNVTEEKLQVLRMQNIQHLDIIFDPDEAGQKGAKKVLALCEKLEITTRNITLPNDLDPGALSESQVLKLKRKLYG